jgi:hypothetical protein
VGLLDLGILGIHETIMVPPESLSQYLSNEYQCYGVSIESNYQYFWHSDFGDKSRPLYLKGQSSSSQPPPQGKSGTKAILKVF